MKIYNVVESTAITFLKIIFFICIEKILLNLEIKKNGNYLFFLKSCFSLEIKVHHSYIHKWVELQNVNGFRIQILYL